MVDAGAEYANYSADITRTWPVGGKFSKEQKNIYSLVLDVQKRCIEKVRPGENLKNLNDLAVKLITKGLIDLGLLQGNLETLIKEDKHRRFFMHKVGHWLGIDVHDVSDIDRGEKFKPGFCFTIEPGIYIPDEEDVPKMYRGIAVRIEDDILVTETGYEVLSIGVVKEIEDIEAIIGIENLP